MPTFIGKIKEVFSEPINGAPVLVTVEAATGDEFISFERRLWNEFFFAHEDVINKPEFRVEVFGEPWQQMILCTDPDCEPCTEFRDEYDFETAQAIAEGEG